MKKVLLAVCVLTVITSACASRIVEQNTFHSSFPKFVVTVSPEIKYTKNIKTVDWREDTRGVQKFWEETDGYYFVVPDSQKHFMIAKAVHVGLKQTEANVQYIRASNCGAGCLEQGTTLLADEKYEFVIGLWLPNMSEKITASLKNSGYVLPRCLFVKETSKIVYKNYIKFVSYWEDASLAGFSCDKTQNRTRQEREAILQEFNKRADASFKVLEN